MVDWKEGYTAPRDRTILVYGVPDGQYGDTGQNDCAFSEGVYLARWDSLDELFCLKGGGWLGPFIEPLYWAEEPEPPVKG